MNCDRRSGKADALEPDALDHDAIIARLEQRIASADESSFPRVVNATGTLLHTNLGRAALPREAIDAVCRAASHAVPLEYDLVRGERGRRESAIEELLVHLTGAEAATVVNNNAAAVLLALNTLASGKEVVVSRGELVEIGGAFRVPDIMAKSGATLQGDRHHQPHACRRLHERHHRTHRPHPQGAHQQLPHRRLRRRRSPAGARCARESPSAFR